MGKGANNNSLENNSTKDLVPKQGQIRKAERNLVRRGLDLTEGKVKHGIKPSDIHSRISSLRIDVAAVQRGIRPAIEITTPQPNVIIDIDQSDLGFFVTGDLRGTLTLWDGGNGKELQRMCCGFRWVYAVSISPDGKHAIAGGTSLTDERMGVYDKPIHVWELSTGQLIRRLNYPNATFSIKHFSGGDRIAIGAGAKEFIKDTFREGGSGFERFLRPHPRIFGESLIWDLDTDRQLLSLRRDEKIVESVDISPDERLLASASYDGSVTLWDIETESLVHDLKGHNGIVYCVRFSHDGKMLCSSGEDASIRVWDIMKGMEVCKWKLPKRNDEETRIWKVQYMPNGRNIISCSNRGIDIWDLVNNEKVGSLGSEGYEARSISLSSDGSRLITGDSTGTIQIFELPLV